MIPQNLIDEIGYFFNDWLKLMGFGGEYNRLVSLIKTLYKFGIRFDKKYYYINQITEYLTEKDLPFVEDYQDE